MTRENPSNRIVALAFTILGLALAALPIAAPVAASPDVVIDGCNVLAAGEIGIRELAGDVDVVVPVPVYLSTNSIVDAIQFEIEFPSDLLAFHSALPGELTGAPWAFGGAVPGGGNRVRVIAHTLEEETIPADTTGTVAIVRFRVLAPGVDLFGLPAEHFAGDMVSYAACDSTNTSPVDPSPWGVIKSRYR